MKTARNLMIVLLLATAAYACEPEELPSDNQTTQAGGDQGDIIIGSDGKPIKR